MAHFLLVVLMLLVASIVARSVAPTWSTAGSVVRNWRSDSSDPSIKRCADMAMSLLNATKERYGVLSLIHQ